MSADANSGRDLFAHAEHEPGDVRFVEQRDIETACQIYRTICEYNRQVMYPTKGQDSGNLEAPKAVTKVRQLFGILQHQRQQNRVFKIGVLIKPIFFYDESLKKKKCC